jgi:putative transposase
MTKYTEEQRATAFKLYDECKSVAKVIQKLGYPGRTVLFKWLKERSKPPKTKAQRKRINNAPNHPFHPPIQTKLEILQRCFVRGENIQWVLEETGYSTSSIYRWRKQYVLEGAIALMPTKDRPRGNLEEGSPISQEELRDMKKQMLDMQMEIDILRETLKVLKKAPGVNWKNLNNKEKTTIVDALKNQYALSLLRISLIFRRVAIITKNVFLSSLINIKI